MGMPRVQEFAAAAAAAGVGVTLKAYVGKTHTQPIVEDPMRGGRDELMDEVSLEGRGGVEVCRGACACVCVGGGGNCHSAIALAGRSSIHSHAMHERWDPTRPPTHSNIHMLTHPPTPNPHAHTFPAGPQPGDRAARAPPPVCHVPADAHQGSIGSLPLLNPLQTPLKVTCGHAVARSLPIRACVKFCAAAPRCFDVYPVFLRTNQKR